MFVLVLIIFIIGFLLLAFMGGILEILENILPVLLIVIGAIIIVAITSS